jgi:hypothetical protein
LQNLTTRRRGKLEDVAQEIIDDNRGMGQFARDYARIQNSNKLFIDSMEETFELSKEYTQWWGLVPKGIGEQFMANMQKELRDLGFEAYIDALPIEAKTLNEIADLMSGMATAILKTVVK